MIEQIGLDWIWMEKTILSLQLPQWMSILFAILNESLTIVIIASVVANKINVNIAIIANAPSASLLLDENAEMWEQ